MELWLSLQNWDDWKIEEKRGLLAKLCERKQCEATLQRQLRHSQQRIYYLENGTEHLESRIQQVESIYANLQYLFLLASLAYVGNNWILQSLMDMPPLGFPMLIKQEEFMASTSTNCELTSVIGMSFWYAFPPQHNQGSCLCKFFVMGPNWLFALVVVFLSKMDLIYEWHSCITVYDSPASL